MKMQREALRPFNLKSKGYVKSWNKPEVILITSVCVETIMTSYFIRQSGTAVAKEIVFKPLN